MRGALLVYYTLWYNTRSKILKECLKCKGVFTSSSKKSKFCSLICANQFNAEKVKRYIEINCKQCGDLVRGRAKFMRNRKFCNSSCAARFNNQFIPKRLPEGQCDHCEQPCSTKRKYCSSECQIKAKSLRHKPKRIAQAQYVKAFRKRQKQLAVDYKGSKCIQCGYYRCLRALEFHHLDPKEKDVNIGTMLSRQKSFDQMKIELDKCILLCSNCHKEEHERLLTLSNSIISHLL